MDNYPLRLYGEGLKEYYFTDFDTLKEVWGIRRPRYSRK